MAAGNMENDHEYLASLSLHADVFRMLNDIFGPIAVDDEGEGDVDSVDSNGSFDEDLLRDSDSDASVLTVTSDASVLTVTSDATRSEYDTASSVSSSSSNSSTISVTTTSTASSRSQSESNDNASTGHRQQEETDPTYSPVSEQPSATDERELIHIMPTPSAPKKRKRLSLEAKDKSTTRKVKSKDDNIDDEADGLTCYICLDNWEMSGEHRLTSLKCGHLFGESCIRRWLQKGARPSGQNICPQCKTKATPRDLRYLYAKRLRAIDRSEEHRMRYELCNERSRCKYLISELATMQMTYAQVTMKVKSLEADNQSIKKKILLTGGHGKNEKTFISYKLFMEKNLELSRESGCRVMKYADQRAALLVCQKSAQGQFPGYGLRFIDASTFKPSNFLHTSLKAVRDIGLSEDQQLLAVASIEQTVKLFDLRTLQPTTQFKSSENPICSCALAHRESEHCLYLGTYQGKTYVYDIRYPKMVLSEHFTGSENNPVLHLAVVPESEKFVCGGFLVCKLTSLWFLKYLSGGEVQSTRLAIEGTLVSMSYDIHSQSLLVQTISSPRYLGARFILGKLDQIDGIPVFDIQVTFSASTSNCLYTRSSQIDVDSNTLVAAYIQDTNRKRISIFDANSEQCIQSLSVLEHIYGTCPVYVKDMTYVAALSESKCRLYKLHSN